MTIEEAIFWGQRTVFVALSVCGPPLLAALVVGLAVSLLQAVTQLNEMTLVFVPKILAVFAVLLLFGGWMLETAVQFASESFESVGDTRQ